MKITVSPDFPNPQPFVEIIHTVADRYLDRMMHKSILLGKLAVLKLYLNPRIPTPEDYYELEEQREKILSMGDSVPDIIREATMEQTVFDRLQSRGSHRVYVENGQIYPVICLEIIPNESHMAFADIVAVMMGHLLLNESMDFIHLGRMAESGTIPAGSSIARKKPNTNTVYGHFMECAVANTIASYVIGDMELSDDTGIYAETMSDRNYEHSEVHLCRLFASAFGDPLEECRYIDEFECVPTKVYPDEADYGLLEPEYDDAGEILPYRFRYSYTIRNPFWYCVVTNAFECITAIYNSHMGENAYETFCSLWDQENLTTETYEMVLLAKIQMERFVETMRKFRQI